MQLPDQCLRDSPDPFLHESKEMSRLCTNFPADGHMVTCHQTEATEVKTTVMERKSVCLPEEVPPTAKAAVTPNGGKSAEAIVP